MITARIGTVSCRQASIARAIEACLQLTVPILAVIIGEGGSGGAVALATADRVLMLEHAVYSVISPEGCAAILWRSGDHAAQAAEAMKITAQDLLALGVIDGVVEEPLGGAHRKPLAAIDAVGDRLAEVLDPLLVLPGPELRHLRRQKFLQMGTAPAA